MNGTAIAPESSLWPDFCFPLFLFFTLFARFRLNLALHDDGDE